MKKSSVHKLPVDHSKLITKGTYNTILFMLTHVILKSITIHPAANECLHQLSTIPLAAKWFQSPEQVQELARKKQVEQLAVSVGRLVQFSKVSQQKREHYCTDCHV